MSQRLNEAAVRGVSSAAPLDPEQVRLLTAGDIEGLFEFHSSVFGSATMARDDEDDEDDDDHDDDDSDEDDDDEDDEDDDEDDSDEDDDEDKDSKGKARRKAKVDPKDTRIQELSAEAKRYRLKNRDYRSQLAAKDAEIARLKGTSKSKEDDTSKDKGTEQTTGLTPRERQQAIQLEFAMDTTFPWQDPKAALKLLDLHDVDVDDDGTVEGLKDAIEKLATDYPFLLAETPKEKEARKGEQTRRRNGATGQSTRTRTKVTSDAKALAAKYNIQR